MFKVHYYKKYYSLITLVAPNMNVLPVKKRRDSKEILPYETQILLTSLLTIWLEDENFVCLKKDANIGHHQQKYGLVTKVLSEEFR